MDTTLISYQAAIDAIIADTRVNHPDLAVRVQWDPGHHNSWDVTVTAYRIIKGELITADEYLDGCLCQYNPLMDRLSGMIDSAVSEILKK